jgi:FkbM family methyltransferase
MAATAITPFFVLVYFSLRIYARLFGPLQLDATLANGVRMKCLLPDAVQICIYLFGVWEPDISAFVRQRLSAGDTFVDIGSHVGYYSLLAAKHLGPYGHVVAIEASPTIFQQLQTNLANNGATNVRALNIAAAAERGVLKVHRGPVWNLGWTTTLEGSGLPLEGEVPALPLDEILTPDERRTTRLIKVDVEGTERELFNSLIKTLQDGINPEIEIIMELSPRWWRGSSTSMEQALEPFLKEGFHIYRINNDYAPWRYLWPDDVLPPQRMRGPMKSWIGQVDVVLSRVDQENL